MDAAGFGSLASHFGDRTVVTPDPRGLGRSGRTDGRTDHGPEQQAADLHSLIGALDAGPVDLFASSGGAVTALALVAAHPGDVGPWSRTSRRSARAAGRGPGAGGRARGAGRYAERGFGRRDGRLHRAVDVAGGVPRRYFAGPRPTRRSSACPPRTTAAATTRCCRGRSTTTGYRPTSTRCGGADPGGGRRRLRVGGHGHRATAAAAAAALGRPPPCSRATTAVSWWRVRLCGQAGGVRGHASRGARPGY